MKSEPIIMDDEWTYPLHMSGQATTLHQDEPEDIVERLRAVVEEVTGKPIERPAKPRMGFLP